MRNRQVLATLALLAGAIAAPTAAAAQIEVEADGTGMAMVTALSSTTAPVTAGSPTWIALNWTNDVVDAEEFEVTASGPNGALVEYPTNTHPISSLWADNVLSPAELDYTALKITAPEGTPSPMSLLVRLRYVSLGQPVESEFELTVPIEQPGTGDVDDGDETGTTIGGDGNATTDTTEADGTTDTTDASDTADTTATTGTGDATTTNTNADTLDTSTTTAPEGWEAGDLLTITNGEWQTTASPSTGAWEVGMPEATSWQGYELQAGSTPSGAVGLFTGLAAGPSAGANDVDGGAAVVVSRPVQLSPSAELVLLSFDYYFAYLSNSTSADYLRVSVVGESGTQQLLEQRGQSQHNGLRWRSAEFDLSSYAGQQVQILIETADDSAGSLVEAGIDDLVLRG
jgi:hypothetical protein